MTKTTILGIAVAAVLVAGLIAFIPAEQAEADGDDLLEGTLLGLPTSFMMLRGVEGGGAP